MIYVWIIFQIFTKAKDPYVDGGFSKGIPHF